MESEETLRGILARKINTQLNHIFTQANSPCIGHRIARNPSFCGDLMPSCQTFRYETKRTSWCRWFPLNVHQQHLYFHGRIVHNTIHHYHLLFHRQISKIFGLCSLSAISKNLLELYIPSLKKKTQPSMPCSTATGAHKQQNFSMQTKLQNDCSQREKLEEPTGSTPGTRHMHMKSDSSSWLSLIGQHLLYPNPIPWWWDYEIIHDSRAWSCTSIHRRGRLKAPPVIPPDRIFLKVYNQLLPKNRCQDQIANHSNGICIPHNGFRNEDHLRS